MSSPAAPALSVVVPTRDRPEALAACLGALAMQSGPGIEVVVVDDGSSDAAQVARVVAAHPSARLVRGGGDGPARARNLGAAEAAAPAVAFTDDDCRPVPTWAAALLAHLDGGAEVVAGPTRNGRPHDPVAGAAQVVTNHLVAASLDPAAAAVGFAPTSNLALRAEVWHRHPFDEAYPLAAGEDREWCARVTSDGIAIAWAPEAVVDHHPALDLRGFWRQQSRYGRGAQRVHGGRGRQPVGFYLDLLRRGWADGPRTGALVVLAQVATADGLVREALTTRRARA